MSVLQHLHTSGPKNRCWGLRKRNTVEIDRALMLVGGSVVAAAKLLDLEPKELRYLIGYTPELKARWGRTQRGRPGNAGVGFNINPWRDPVRRGTKFTTEGLIVVLKGYKHDELAGVQRWLADYLKQWPTQERALDRHG